MSLIQTYWSTVGDWEQAKSWDATNGPANEWEHVKLLEGLGTDAFRENGQLKRPEEFPDPATRQRAFEAWHGTGGGMFRDFGEQTASFLNARFSELPEKFEHALSFGPVKRRLRGEDAPGEPRTSGTNLRDYLFDRWF